MSEIKTLEDMCNTVKTIAADCDEGWILGCLDAIEAEIAEKYMELPVDADGVPIRVGENLRSACSETEYTALGFWFDFDCSIWQVMVSSKQAMSGNMLRHVKPRTVEDVLRDFLDEKVYTSKTYERYAAEIRELLGVGE